MIVGAAPGALLNLAAEELWLARISFVCDQCVPILFDEGKQVHRMSFEPVS